VPVGEANVAAAPAVAEHGHSQIGEAESVVQFAIGDQATVGRNARTMKLELDPAVETEPQRRLAAFTLRVRHSKSALSLLSC